MLQACAWQEWILEDARNAYFQMWYHHSGVFNLMLGYGVQLLKFPTAMMGLGGGPHI